MQKGWKVMEENHQEAPQETVSSSEEHILLLPDNRKIELLTISGEVEGHDASPKNSKTTKYEQVLPRLAHVEHSSDIVGVLVLLNTVGGDVEAGLAIAEMIASLSKPVVSLVLGGSHSIGVPLAVSSDYSFIVETGTMTVHPVRTTGTILGVAQSFEYLERIQERILSFTAKHSRISVGHMRELMLNTKVFTKDLGTLLGGEEAVAEGIIDAVGGIQDAIKKLRELIDATQPAL